jgi:hypothetical protein
MRLPLEDPGYPVKEQGMASTDERLKDCPTRVRIVVQIYGWVPSGHLRDN